MGVHDVVVRGEGGIVLSEHLQELADDVVDLAKHGLSDATRHVYESARDKYHEWCVDHGVGSPWPVTAEALCLWIAELRRKGLTIGSIRTYARAVGRVSVLTFGGVDPMSTEAVKSVLRGARRTMPALTHQKDALTAEHVLRLLPDPADTSNRAVRDRALLLLGLAAGLRRSELVALDFGDLTWESRGVVVRIRRSKTDPFGMGEDVGVLYSTDRRLCAPTALLAWQRLVEPRGGSEVFRPITKGDEIRHRRLTGGSVARIVQARARTSGVSVDLDVAAHSLRAGMATELARRGAKVEAIAKQGRWRSLNMVLRYIRPVTAFEDNPSALF